MSIFQPPPTWYTPITSSCGASLVAPNVLLTSADCSHQLTGREVLFHQGDTSPQTHGTMRNVEIDDIHFHPQYDWAYDSHSSSNKHHHNLALIELKEHVHVDFVDIDAFFDETTLANSNGTCLVY